MPGYFHGPYLRRWTAPKAGSGGYHFWCPGCQSCHTFQTEARDGGPTWKYDGDLSRPTFDPSLLLWVPLKRGGEEVQPPIRRTICHLFVTDGKIVYCPDSPHSLSGKTVPMEPIPRSWGFGDDDDGAKS